MATSGSPAGRPRSLLFLWTDEQRPDTLGVYHGARAAAPAPLRGRTPNVDRLAAGGVVFERAYCAEPLCTPSRATVLTGLYPHAHGALHNNVPLPDAAPTLAEMLAPAGYRCGYAGKWHLGDELRPQRGFGWWSSTEDQYVHDHRAHGFSSYHQWLVSQGHAPPDRAADGARIWSRESARAAAGAPGQARLPGAGSVPLPGRAPGRPRRRALRAVRQLPRAAHALLRSVGRPLPAGRRPPARDVGLGARSRHAAALPPAPRRLRRPQPARLHRRRRRAGARWRRATGGWPAWWTSTPARSSTTWRRWVWRTRRWWSTAPTTAR